MGRYSKGAPVFDDEGFQHERTSLAWERTAFSLLVNGALLGRYGANDGMWIFAGVGIAIATVGTGILIWTGYNYQTFHEVLESGASPVHPGATRWLGIVTTFTASAALIQGILVALEGSAE